jgi:hypothetical protein
MAINFDRYRVFTWDQFTRLWCEECYTEGNELHLWSETAEPVSLLEFIAYAAEHELACHALQDAGRAIIQGLVEGMQSVAGDGHPPSESISEGDPPS